LQLSRLPLRDTAGAEPAELAAQCGAAVVSGRWSRLQPPRRADRALLDAGAPPSAAARRDTARPLPGDADRERQPLVPELAHDRAGARVLRRPRAPAPLPARAAGGRTVAAPSRRGVGAGRAGRGAERRAGAQSALAAPGDEPLVRSAASREHV